MQRRNKEAVIRALRQAQGPKRIDKRPSTFDLRLATLVAEAI